MWSIWTCRCRKLPKALKEWPAFHALKWTVDDFNDMCPLLELMANKAMKPRHWHRITEVLKHNFDLESENFCLKNILEAPLLKHKEDIEVSLFAGTGLNVVKFFIWSMLAVNWITFSGMCISLFTYEFWNTDIYKVTTLQLL